MPDFAPMDQLYRVLGDPAAADKDATFDILGDEDGGGLGRSEVTMVAKVLYEVECVFLTPAALAAAGDSVAIKPRLLATKRFMGVVLVDV